MQVTLNSPFPRWIYHANSMLYVIKNDCDHHHKNGDKPFAVNYTIGALNTAEIAQVNNWLTNFTTKPITTALHAKLSRYDKYFHAGILSQLSTWANISRTTLLEWAIVHDYYNMFVHLYDTHLTSSLHISTNGVLAGKYNRLGIIKHLHAKNVKFSPQLMELAAMRGYIGIVQWLHEHGYAFTTHVVKTAATHGHLQLIQWLYSHNAPFSKINLLNIVSCYGYLEVVQWLHTLETGGVTTAPIGFAAKHGHFHIVKWLHEHGYGCTTYAIDYAASNGHLEIVQWLHEHGAGCTTYAIDWAATNGHLDVMRWLHKHRTEGFTRLAIAHAASNGHLEAVRWLHEHGCVCKLTPMNCAAKHGHLEVVRWLHEHGAGCTSSAMNMAAANGHLNTVRWLLFNKPNNNVPAAIVIADNSNHSNIAQFLLSSM